MLRAPHDGHGAVGDCPHCEAELRVPGGPDLAAEDPTAFLPVGRPLAADELHAAVADAAPPQKRIEVPAPAAEPAPAGPPAGPAAPEEVLLEFEEVSEEPAVAVADGEDEMDPVVRRSARRRRKKRGSPVVAGLLVLGLMTGAGAAGYALYNRLGGPAPVVLAATELPPDAAEPATLVPPATADPAAVAVVQAGVPMRSPLLTVTLDAAPGPDGGPADPPRVRVRVEPGEAGKLVRVFFGDRPEFAAWQEARRDLVGTKRLAFVKARDAFFAAVAAGGDVGRFRDSVALNAARDVPGWAIEAVAGDRVVPCCREREDRSLLFCVPLAATVFTLRGRDVPGEGMVFPHTYEVRVR